MTSLGILLRAPDTESILPVSRLEDGSSGKGTRACDSSPINEDGEWDKETTGKIAEIGLGLSRSLTKGKGKGCPISMSLLEDPYMLGHNSKTIGVSSWTVVGPSRDNRSVGERDQGGDSPGTGEIQVTVEVSMRTNPRTKSWTRYG